VLNNLLFTHNPLLIITQFCAFIVLHITQELNANGGQSSLLKKERGRRNLICVKFLSGMYREVINDEANAPSRDGLSLMIVASSYYAIGKFGPALSVFQRAGIELKKQISNTFPGYTNHCAKLFNNMGCVYFEMQKYEKAMQTFQRALQLFHKDYDDDYVSWVAAILDQAAIMNNMAYILLKFKQYDDASDLIDVSFELQQILPRNTDSTVKISTLSTMAYIYYRTKKYRLSLDTYTGEFRNQQILIFFLSANLFSCISFINYLHSLRPTPRQEPDVQRERSRGGAQADGRYLQKDQGS
jgi:tetratricopeptide (TPR) repeat protein